jgi:hypothetical protein
MQIMQDLSEEEAAIALQHGLMVVSCGARTYDTRESNEFVT